MSLAEKKVLASNYIVFVFPLCVWLLYNKVSVNKIHKAINECSDKLIDLQILRNMQLGFNKLIFSTNFEVQQMKGVKNPMFCSQVLKLNSKKRITHDVKKLKI